MLAFKIIHSVLITWNIAFGISQNSCVSPLIKEQVAKQFMAYHSHSYFARISTVEEKPIYNLFWFLCIKQMFSLSCGSTCELLVLSSAEELCDIISAQTWINLYSLQITKQEKSKYRYHQSPNMWPSEFYWAYLKDYEWKITYREFEKHFFQKIPHI